MTFTTRYWVLLAVAVSSSQSLFAQGAKAAAPFVGSWRLVSIDTDSTTATRLGAHPTGIIIYDQTNHMAVQIQPDRRRPSWPSRVPTAAEALDAVVGYVAYFGTYVVDERASTVTHHRE